MNTLTPECRAFLLEQARTGKLATVRADGRPHVVPIWFDLDGDSIVFSTWHTSVKAKNIQHDAHISLCVDDEKPPYRFALIEGTAAISSDMDLLKTWARRLAGRYLGAELAEEYGARNSVEGEVIVRITPTKVLFQENIAS
jgi:PPOX class probable F420-dependent enzyme